MSSQPGQAWRTYYQAGSLTWLNPEQLTSDWLIRWTRSEWITRMLRATGLRPGRHCRVLEAGCGTGVYGIALALMGYPVDAFDYNLEAVDIARYLVRKIERSGYSLPIRVYQGDLLHIPAAPNTYDLVFNQAVLEYFGDGDRQAAIREMARVTKRGGNVVAIVQHTGHPFRPLWTYLDWPGYTNQPPVAEYTPKILGTDLESAGFSSIFLDGIRPWKAFFFWPAWYTRRQWTEKLVYLIDRALERGVPLPNIARQYLGIQMLGMGTKDWISSNAEWQYAHHTG
jgi:SAM-dependent methyltransferase